MFFLLLNSYYDMVYLNVTLCFEASNEVQLQLSLAVLLYGDRYILGYPAQNVLIFRTVQAINS